MEFERAKVMINEQKVKEILDKLEEPFDPDVLYWKPQAVNHSKDKALAAAYADPRAYQDRLNETVGAQGWSTHYEVSTIHPIPGPDPKDWKNKFIYKGKVLVVATLSIEGVGQNSGTGESDAVDENAITSAEAQAFKRAATRFGLGRYLYDLPKGQWVAYDDSTKRITDPPALPEWAIPKRTCQDCNEKIEPYEHQGHVYSVTELIAASQRKYKRQLCSGCQRVRATKPSAVEAMGGKAAVAKTG